MILYNDSDTPMIFFLLLTLIVAYHRGVALSHELDTLGLILGAVGEGGLTSFVVRINQTLNIFG